MGLTEVVCHQGRCGDRGLRELLSPAALLLQVLQWGESIKKNAHLSKSIFIFWPLKDSLFSASYLCSNFKDWFEVVRHRGQFRLWRPTTQKNSNKQCGTISIDCIKKKSVHFHFHYYCTGNKLLSNTCKDTTIVLEWLWICRPPGAPRDLTRSCSCAICLFRLLMSCKYTEWRRIL